MFAQNDKLPMSTQQIKFCVKYYYRLLGLTIVLCSFLPSTTFARSNPYLDSTELPEKAGDTINPKLLMQNFLTWDTNRIDEETARLYAELSRVYAETGDKEKAYHFFEKYSKIKDSLFYQAKNLEIHKLKQDLAAAAKDKELAAKNTQMMHNQELANRKNAIVLGLAGGILLILILCLQIFIIRLQTNIFFFADTTSCKK